MSNTKIQFIGRVIRHFETLDSTNSYANILLSKSKPEEGTVISTYNQYAGRGQIGSKWESEPGKNISLSIILYPHFLKPQEQFHLNRAISLGVHAFIESHLSGQTTKIKWPNDIYVNDRKIAGILIQNSINQRFIQYSIIGIGVNINQTIFSKFVPNPTSFTLETGKEFPLPFLIQDLCSHLDHYYKILIRKELAELSQLYLGRLFRVAQNSKFMDAKGEVFLGTITGVTDFGQLEVEINKQKMYFATKEITFL